MTLFRDLRRITIDGLGALNNGMEVLADGAARLERASGVMLARTLMRTLELDVCRLLANDAFDPEIATKLAVFDSTCTELLEGSTPEAYEPILSARKQLDREVRERQFAALVEY